MGRVRNDTVNLMIPWDRSASWVYSARHSVITHVDGWEAKQIWESGKDY